MTGAERYFVTALKKDLYSLSGAFRYNLGDLIVIGSTEKVGANSLGDTKFGFVMAMASEGCLEYWTSEASALAFTAISLSSDYELDDLFSFPLKQNLQVTVNADIQFDRASKYGENVDYQDEFCEVTSITQPFLTNTVTVSYGDRISYKVEGYEYSLEQCTFGEMEWSFSLVNDDSFWSTEVDFD